MDRLIFLHNSVFSSVERMFDGLVPLLARFVFAVTLLMYFWSSAMTKLGDGIMGVFIPSSGAYAQIFPKQLEAVVYDVSQLSIFHWAVVVAGTWAEFILPLLIVIGLFTRLAALGGFEEHEVRVAGRGWNEVAVDLVLPGLGWIAVTGAGVCTVGVSLPRPVRVVMREPLLPEESWKKSASKFTGTKIIDGKGNAKRQARSRQ